MENQISISRSDLWSLERLKTHGWPRDCYARRSVGAYIVILFAGNEHGDLDWLCHFLSSFQSRFWAPVGSFIFFQRYSLLLRVGNSSASGRNSHATIELPFGEIAKPFDLPAQLVKMVEQGRLAPVMDGDQLVVIDHRNEEIAQVFGVAGQLPCVLVFDVSPRRHFLLYELGATKGYEFYRSTARAIERFRSQDGFRQWVSAIARLEAAPKRIQDAEQSIARCAEGIPQQYLEYLEKRLALLRNFLAAGQTRRFVDACTGGYFWGDRFNRWAAVEVVKREAHRLQQFAKTIRCLEYYYQELPWPLEEPWSTRFDEIWRRYVRDSAPKASESAADVDRELVLQAKVEIRGRQDQVIDEILRAFTSGMTLPEFVVTDELERYRTAKRTAEVDALTAAKSVCAEDRPSLISAFCVQIPNSEVREFSEAAGRTLAKYMEPYLTSETLLEAVAKPDE